MSADVADLGVAAGAVRRHRRGRQVAALMVVAGSAVLAVWGTPAPASEAAFGAALRSGQVRAVSPAADGRYGLELLAPLPVGARLGGGAGGGSVVWASRWGRLYRTNVSTLAGLPDPSQSAATEPAGDVASRVDVYRSVVATAAAAGVPVPRVSSLGPYGWLGWPLVLAWLAGVLLLVGGPQPRRVTKWGLFWVLGLPPGIGLAWWVLRDAPWDPRMSALPAPAPRLRGVLPSGVVRAGGGTSFLRVLMATVVLGVLWTLLGQVTALGSPAAPSPGSVTWSVVWSSGSHGSLHE